MHFKLPKPLHGWREFAGEVAIIVLGVLIALGAEQVVETLHWKHEVAAERASLRQEASDMLTGIAARRDQMPCVDRRLAEIRTVIERHRRGQPLGLVGKIGRPTRQSATRGSWQIALSGQALTHMPHAEKLALSDAFGGFDLWDQLIAEERETWLRMAALNIPDLLTEEDWSDIRAAYVRAVEINNSVRVLAPWTLEQDSRDLPGIENYQAMGDLSAFRPLTDQFCKPVLASARPANGA
jgi:hypothetical protein